MGAKKDFKQKKEMWSPADLPDPGIEPKSPALAGRFFTTEPPQKPMFPVE